MEHGGGLLTLAFVYLGAAVLSVPIAKRLGLGSVLGYLIAGVMIGPYVFGIVGDAADVMHFAEFGVVMMLFLVGLELQPSLLWRMRGPILGLGGAQMIVTAALIAGIAIGFGLGWREASAIGLIFGMSSTAIVLQTLNERGLMKTEAGRSSFSVLLFQDIAVIPILAVLPLLAIHEAVGGGDGHSGAMGNLPDWMRALVVVGAMVGLVVVGRFLSRPAFRFIAGSKLREVFTAAALLLVIGTALAMELVGLSPALGTFVAGVVLADSEYRHELEANIEPFKGLLLGLFFISVGASIDFGLLFKDPLGILGMVMALVVVKFLVLLLLGVVFKMALRQRLLFSFMLAQGGEFAFVLFSFATNNHVLSSEVASPLVVVVALTMALTPLLMIVHDRFVSPRFKTDKDEQKEPDAIDEENPVIIAGFGRFGQIVARLLHANKIGTTVLDYDSGQINLLRKFGFKVFYGDASRLDLLHTAGAERAKLLVLAIDDQQKSLDMVESVRESFPNLKILARAIDRVHAYELMNRGVDHVFRETFASSVDMGVAALKLLGFRSYQAVRAGVTFKNYDEHSLQELAKLRGDESAYVSRAVQFREELKNLLSGDDRGLLGKEDHSWESAPPKG